MCSTSAGATIQDSDSGLFVSPASWDCSEHLKLFYLSLSLLISLWVLLIILPALADILITIGPQRMSLLFGQNHRLSATCLQNLSIKSNLDHQPQIVICQMIDSLLDFAFPGRQGAWGGITYLQSPWWAAVYGKQATFGLIGYKFAVLIWWFQPFLMWNLFSIRQ